MNQRRTGKETGLPFTEHLLPYRVGFLHGSDSTIISPLQINLNRIVKRAFDILFSFLVFVFVLSWVLPVLCIYIKLRSGGPVFFGQKRTGLDNRVFTCWKLCTMKKSAEANLIQATVNDSRVTEAGRILRKFSLDELPQFYNVLRGEMSVIGPRPHMLKHTEEFSREVDNYEVRHLVKPGITGLSQVLGYRGEIQNPGALKNRVRLDIFYLRHWSFMFDLFIVLRTVKLLLVGDKNAY